ncbi:MAG: VPLPA-CTERM sorting domain-containing protein [Methylobacter sp.]|nr:VPLPA-CTERM sorting domain-containing protein [Methylobacter sp.]
MNKNILLALVLFGLSAGAAHASLIIDGVHESTNINQIETYFIKANSTGNVDIFIQSQPAVGTTDSFMNGFLSVWQQVGSNWSLVGFNDDAPRVGGSGPTSVFGQSVLGFIPGQPDSGLADPGLPLSLAANNTYLLIQSENHNEPTGSIGQLLVIGSPLQNGFTGLSDLSGGTGEAYSIFNNYQLHINGDVSLTAPPAAVPLPAAVWLFGSAVAGLGLFGRKKVMVVCLPDCV